MLDFSYIQSEQSSASGLTFGEKQFTFSPLGWCSFPNPLILFTVQCLRRTLPLVGATSEGPAVAGSSRVGGFLWASEESAGRPLVCSEQSCASDPIRSWRIFGWLVGSSGMFAVAMEQASIGECC